MEDFQPDKENMYDCMIFKIAYFFAAQSGPAQNGPKNFQGRDLGLV
jgi:hypothetical protein